jgi:8-oxo-dGTP diphosphatase
VPDAPSLLARGHWSPDQVETVWRDDPWLPTNALERSADDAIDALRERGSPSHDGMAARLASFDEHDHGLRLELQPVRWALRLVDAGDANSLTALCVVRDEDGRWLAGRRAAWLATWAGRWALGAGGSVELGEDPVETLGRELQEEWQLDPLALSVEALAALPSGLVALVGLATVAAGSDPVRDAEHDEFAWWPPDPARWPDQADDRLRLMGRMLSGG